MGYLAQPREEDEALLERCRLIWSYRPSDGLFFWNALPVTDFAPTPTMSAAKVCQRWNAAYAGQLAGTQQPWAPKILKRCSKVHGELVVRGERLAWAMVHGEWPKGRVWFRGNDKSDTRISNLMVVDGLWG